MKKVARVGQYTLSIEEMRPGIWWWSVTYGLETIDRNGSYGKHCKNEKEAIQTTEAVYLRHLHRENLPTWIQV